MLCSRLGVQMQLCISNVTLSSVIFAIGIHVGLWACATKMQFVNEKLFCASFLLKIKFKGTDYFLPILF
jgi:hypothetical protein